MDKTKHKLVYLDNGVIIVGKVVKETKTKLSLSYPCIVMFVEDNDGSPAMQLSLLAEPNLTDERIFEIDSKKFLFESQEPRENLIKIYEDFVAKQQDLDSKEESVIETK